MGLTLKQRTQIQHRAAESRREQMQLCRMMSPLRVPLLCTLLSLVTTGNSQKDDDWREIISQPGTDVLLPIRHPIPPNPTEECLNLRVVWKYTGNSADQRNMRRAECKTCAGSEDDATCQVTGGNEASSNYGTSRNGSLILYNVSRDYEGNYTASIFHKSTTEIIYQRYYMLHYTLRVRDPLSGISVNVSCLPDGSAEALCWVHSGSHPQYSWTLDGRSVSIHSWTTLPPRSSGTLRCEVTNGISHVSESIYVSCPGPPAVTWKSWGHLLSPVAVCVLYTVLLCCIISDFWTLRDTETQTDDSETLNCCCVA
ncbi:uncharacterized protein [Hyperolius riggenbachi]|uniref:uncharacterized protein n=1 Tax=Hyperolius riggenbachi TaxID=752182 RepID=UPI0035A3546B